jgi:phosphate/phosphite/phosphonate ABC transporter binding protein
MAEGEAEAETRYVLGLTAQGRPDLAEPLAALTAWLSARTKFTIVAEASDSYQALAKKIADGGADLAWLPPLVFVRLERRGIVTALVTSLRAGRSTYQAVLVVRPDSEVRTLDALKGARAAWVDPLSAAGYILPRSQLQAQGIDPSELFAEERFLGSHPAALEAVRKGEADVAGTHGAPGEGEALMQEAADPTLRVLATLGGIPADVIAARVAMPEAARAEIARALVLAGEDPEMAKVARKVFGIESFCLGSTASYAGLFRSLSPGLAGGLLEAIDAPSDSERNVGGE